MSEVKTNKITSLASNNDITLDPDGTGNTIIASGEVGVGTTTPATFTDYVSSSNAPSVVVAGSQPSYVLADTDVSGSSSTLGITKSGDSTVINNLGGGNIDFYNNGGHRMRLDSNGHLLVVQTSLDTANVGHSLASTGFAHHTRDGNIVMILNRKSSDGEVLELRKNDTGFAQFKVTDGDNLTIDCTSSNHAGFTLAADSILPRRNGSSSDDAIDLGSSGDRFDDVFATNGTIQTSDQNEKQDIASLTTAEMTAAKAISKLFKTYKWKSKVAAKGDAARTHTGVIAQEVQTAMSDAGLDAADYAFWCSDTWTNDDGNEQTRLGIRYAELLSFIGAATEQRLADIETRLTALEA